MPGALESLSLCARLSLPVAVCSGSYAMVIEAALIRLGIASDVSVWHSAEWEPLGKPHPGSYLSTAAKLGVDPTGCLAVEDSFNGAIAAKAARMRVVVVPEPDALGSPRWGFCDALAPLAHRASTSGCSARWRAGRPDGPKTFTSEMADRCRYMRHEGHSLGRGDRATEARHRRQAGRATSLRSFGRGRDERARGGRARRPAVTRIAAGRRW